MHFRKRRAAPWTDHLGRLGCGSIFARSGMAWAWGVGRGVHQFVASASEGEGSGSWHCQAPVAADAVGHPWCGIVSTAGACSPGRPVASKWGSEAGLEITQLGRRTSTTRRGVGDIEPRRLLRTARHLSAGCRVPGDCALRDSGERTLCRPAAGTSHRTRSTC